jgi:hypothetical protein
MTLTRAKLLTASAAALIIAGCGSSSSSPTRPAGSPAAAGTQTTTPPTDTSTSPTTTTTATTPTTGTSTSTTSPTTTSPTGAPIETPPTATSGGVPAQNGTISCPGGFDNLKHAYDPAAGHNAWYADIVATNTTCATAIRIIGAYGKGTGWSLSAKYTADGFDCVSVVHQLGPQQFTGTGTCTQGSEKVGWTDPPGD